MYMYTSRLIKYGAGLVIHVEIKNRFDIRLTLVLLEPYIIHVQVGFKLNNVRLEWII